MADIGSDFNETDEFNEYNPTPYKGGYDIALTYGHPLPPSSAICYPISSSVSDAPPPTPLPLPPPPSHPQEPPVVHGGDEILEPYHPSTYDYGPSYIPEPYAPDLYGFSPFCRPEEAEQQRCSNPLRRAADYLFGYSHGYGERRIGIDSYGIPIYAYKRHSNLPLVVQEPSGDQKLDYYEAECSSSYDERKDESHNYGNPTYAYNRHYYEQPVSVKVESVEPVLSQKLSYHETYEEQVYPETKWVSSSYHERVNETNLCRNHQFDHHRHYYEQPLDVQLEPFKPAWSQKLSNYEAYQEPSSLQHSSYSEQLDEGNFFGNPQHHYERHNIEEPHFVELEPYKPSWSQNLTNYEVYEGVVSPKSNWHSSLYNEQGAETNISRNPNYAYERHYHEQPLSVQLEPFKPTWYRYPSFYEGASTTFEEGDYSYKESATQSFSSSLKYSRHDDE